MIEAGATLGDLRSDPIRTAILLDFDGTLSEIALRPEMARPAPDAVRLLGDLSRAYGVVALVSGRRAEELRELVPVSSVEIFGLYGLAPVVGAGAVRSILPAVEGIVARHPGARLEDKGPSVAVHFRETADPAATEAALESELAGIADRGGLTLLPGKMVLELAPRTVPGKGSVVRREVLRHRVAACLYAGDDVADLDAFRALEELRTEGILTVKVAVSSEETPRRLIESADVVVQRPSGLLELLRSLLN
ncbi:MAG: trehalose-phosphatase [Actinobacteria bacterium]|nr:trehalose-phosphatase [Actinomycetota bacterium]